MEQMQELQELKAEREHRTGGCIILFGVASLFLMFGFILGMAAARLL